MMALPASLQFSYGLGASGNQSHNRQPLRVLGRSKLSILTSPSSFQVPDCRRFPPSFNINMPIHALSCKSRAFKCRSFLVRGQPNELPVAKVAATALARSCNVLQSSFVTSITVMLIAAVAFIVFAIWGVSPFLCQMRKLLVPRNDGDWKKSFTHYELMSFLQPFLLLTGIMLIFRFTTGSLWAIFVTLCGREILTNFLSSVAIHVTQPFVANQWIQTKIAGYEVSGTVEHVGMWSPTIIRGEDREAVHIPNTHFTVNIVRNLSEKTHWRIKTHLAISHLDFRKIKNIVADMRQVLARNPQVEQNRLHNRVFLDNINSEN